MKLFLFPFTLFTLTFGFLIMTFADNQAATTKTPPFRHVVFFKFKEDAPKEKIAKVEKEFIALKGKIDQIRDLEWGTSESVENLNDGFTHCFFVTFDKKADLEAYIVHPEHKVFVKLLKDILDKVFVFDYSAK